MGVGGSELGITERASHRNHRADDPNAHHPADVTGNAGHHRWGLKYTRANHNTNNDGDCTGAREQALRHRVGGVIHALD